MKNLSFIFVLVTCLLLPFHTALALDWSTDVVVAKDGSGDYTTITEAINSNPNDGSNYVIFIKNGTYNEKLFITTDNITLLGESRDETIITQAILRRIFRENNPSAGDWGVATINIQNGVSGLTLANLTVQNNFADVYPDTENPNDHTMTIRGGGDKVIIVNCNITATGGDTLSLWNTDDGRFYHSGCFFEGYVDYVCPRGYCYISNSDFYGYNGGASIWHDGEGGKDHKFVVRNSWFDGIDNFGLGRFHRQSAFYLIECDFSENMRDNGGIWYAGDSTGGNDRDKLNYGIRTYYDACMRTAGNYPWHANNLLTAEGSPVADSITDSWTFNDTWNPEAEIPGLLECAFLPNPGYRAKQVSDKPILSWLSGKNAEKHLIYFGGSEELDFISETADTFYQVGTTLNSASEYFWRIDEVTTGGDTITGSTWSFFTDITQVPAQVYAPYPPVDTNMGRYVLNLTWKAYALEVDTFKIYFGNEDTLSLVASQPGIGYSIEGLEGDTTYYWRVDAQNKIGTTTGPIWRFDYKKIYSSDIRVNETENSNLQIFPNPVSDHITIRFNLEKQNNVSVFVNDIDGRQLHFQDLGSVPSGQYQQTIDLSSLSNKLSNKMCFLSIQYAGRKEVFTLVIR